jgi:RNA polymerase sigma-70 factor, ECF subfamily
MGSSPTPLHAALAGGRGRLADASKPSHRTAAQLTREERLAALLNGWFRMVWRALRRFGVPAEAADDAAQEVFIIASRKLEQIEAGRERQFLYGVAIRVAANVRRARAARPERAGTEALDLEPGSTPNPETLLDRKQTRERFDAILEAMPEEQRTAFVLFELEGCSGPEVAALLEVPLGTATSRLHRARASFRAAVEELRAELAGGKR